MILQFCLDLLFPRRCINCGAYDSVLCTACQATIPCALAKIQLDEMSFIDRAYTITSYDHELVQQVVHICKYKSIDELAQSIGSLIAVHVRSNHSLVNSSTCLTPVPLAAQRLRWRGFNQAEILAKQVAVALELPVWQGVSRTVNTSHQVGLNAQQRVWNMAKAFRAQSAVYRRVILIDDVATTGATLDACAKILKEKGAEEVFAITFAHGGDY